VRVGRIFISAPCRALIAKNAIAQQILQTQRATVAQDEATLKTDQALIDSMKKKGVWQMAATLSREASMFAYGQTPPFINDPFFTRSVSQTTLR